MRLPPDYLVAGRYRAVLSGSTEVLQLSVPGKRHSFAHRATLGALWAVLGSPKAFHLGYISVRI